MQNSGITPFQDYIIQPDSNYDESDGFLVEDDQSALSVRGWIIDKPKHLPGGKGSTIYFQYNAHFNAIRYKGLMFLDPALVYSVDNEAQNGWIIFDKIPEVDQGRVLKTSKRSFLVPGNVILFDPKYAHRIEKLMFNSQSFWAIKEKNVLMYR